MDTLNWSPMQIVVGILLLGALGRFLYLRLQLLAAKQPTLQGHARIARFMAALLPAYEFDARTFFVADAAPADVAATRLAGFARLAALYAERYPRGRALTAVAEQGLSDLSFTARYRVPFQFAGHVRRHLSVGAFAASSSGPTVTDIDGNQYLDLTGSYGLNVFGIDFYKDCIRAGSAHVQELGPVLGAYHPLVADNQLRLRKISGLDEVSFHMSGTEAVMQAVRLARYHTRRRHVVRFSGSYHGWWGDVQPGIGNPVPARDTFTLREMAAASLRVLRTRRDIACVLVNPLQGLHPNAAAPGDSALIDSSRNAHFDRAGYTAWLRDLRAVCTARGIVLIFDEVFLGFRIAAGGAQEYFGVAADMVTYGKTLGGGLPVGVLCGRREYMRRFREDRPADICFARGTFNSHPYVMGAMHEFLTRLESPQIRALYQDLDATWNARACELNRRLEEAGVPVRVANFSTIFTVIYTEPSRYNWMLQYYLRAAGLALSWVGTGRLIFSLNHGAADFEAVVTRMVAAAQAMQRDGWWWQGAKVTNRSIRRRILRESIQAWWPGLAMGSISSPRSRNSGAR